MSKSSACFLTIQVSLFNQSLDYARSCAFRAFVVSMHDEIWLFWRFILHLQARHSICFSFEPQAVDPFGISLDADAERRINVDL